MTTYDRNRNAITTGSRVMVSGTGHTGKILSIDTEGLTAEQIRRGKTVVVEGCEEKLAPLALIRLGMNYSCECRRRRHCFFYFTEYFATVAFAPSANKARYASVTLSINKTLSGKSLPNIASIAINACTRA